MDNSIVDSLSGTTAGRRDDLFRWLAVQGDAVRQEAVQMQSELAMGNREKYDKAHRTEFYYAMLVKALAKLHWSDRAHKQKGTLTDKEAAALSARRRARIKAVLLRRHKPSPKKEIIRIQFFEEIKRLKADGLSWRQIALYIKTYHKQSFGFTYLKAAFETLERERAMEVES